MDRSWWWATSTSRLRNFREIVIRRLGAYGNKDVHDGGVIFAALIYASSSRTIYSSRLMCDEIRSAERARAWAPVNKTLTAAGGVSSGLSPWHEEVRSADSLGDFSVTACVVSTRLTHGDVRLAGFVRGWAPCAWRTCCHRVVLRRAERKPPVGGVFAQRPRAGVALFSGECRNLRRRWCAPPSNCVHSPKHSIPRKYSPRICEWFIYTFVRNSSRGTAHCVHKCQSHHIGHYTTANDC